jgi:GNAT superfamily N-acetyltransferase
MDLVAVADEPTRAAARELLEEYLRWIGKVANESYGLVLDVPGMVESDLGERSKFYPPTGRIYLLGHEGRYAGVGCMKRLAPAVGEIQRMYVRPQARGKGGGRCIVERLIEDARLIGYRTLRLESLRALTAAHALYRSVGFVEIPPYAKNSMEHYHSAADLERYRGSAVFMELRL